MTKYLNRILIYLLICSVLFSQEKEDSYKIGVDYKSKIKIASITENEKDAIQNVIEASLNANVAKVVCVGTDKAVSPLNTYGATKLLAEKLFVSANNYLDKEKYRTKFFAVRYGNVLGSSGSVVPLFIKQIKSKQKITITNSNMTRFSITMSEALDFILHATKIGEGSEIFIPKLNSYSITDVKTVLEEILGNTGEEEIGIRPGEKLHEVLINTDEMKYVWEIDDTYVLINPLYHQFFGDNIKTRYPNAKKIESMKIYSSENVEKISKDKLKHLISNLV